MFTSRATQTYTTLIPALLMGNTVVMKLPRVGVLCHIPTLKLFQVRAQKYICKYSYRDIWTSGHLYPRAEW
jgi:hypothetical protein